MSNASARGLAKSVVALFLFLLFPGPEQGNARKHQRQHLPPEILKAKTVFFTCDLPMDNTPGYVIARLKQWGRFRLEEDHKKADLILAIDGFPPPEGARLTISDTGYRHTLWVILTDGGFIPVRCIRLIDILRKQIESEEAIQKQAAPAVPNPAPSATPIPREQPD